MVGPFKLILLGIVLYAGYDQFFLNENKTKNNSNVISSNEFTQSVKRISHEDKFIPLKENITKIKIK